VVSLGKRRRRGLKKPYPRREDIADAILRVLAKKPHIHPSDLVEEVKVELESLGFYAGLVNAKRVWSIYEEWVKTGRMYDYLGVLAEDSLKGLE